MLLNILSFILAVIVVILIIIALSGIRFFPNSRIGIVEKRFGTKTLRADLSH